MSTGSDTSTGPPSPGLVWHELECGSAGIPDMPVWVELAAQTGGEVLELGCGSGRVGLALARAGHRVTGIDFDAELVAAFNQSAAAAGLRAEAILADARGLNLDRLFALVLAPMQMIQLLATEAERAEALSAIAAHLEPGGLAAFAIVELDAVEADSEAGVLPDIRDFGGWVYSSMPVAIEIGESTIVAERLRERVSPDGERVSERYRYSLARIEAADLEGEAAAQGLLPHSRLSASGGERFVPSSVVVLERQR